MKRLLTAVCGLGLLCSSAQAEGFGLFGSFWDPDEGGSVYGVGARARGGPGLFYLGLRGTYYENVIQRNADLQAIPVDLSLGLQLAPVEQLDLYGGVGATYYFLDTGAGKVDDVLGWLAEAGAEVTITPRIGVFGEFVWRMVKATVVNDDVNDISRRRTDYNMDGIAVNLGLIFH